MDFLSQFLIILKGMLITSAYKNVEDKKILQEEDLLIEQGLKGCIKNEEQIKFGHAYLPYSHWRVKEFFLSCGIELRPYFMWYKAMRYQPCQRYVLHDLQTNEVYGDERGYTLYELCCFLAKNNVPLHSEQPKAKKNYNKTKRRQSCVDFLNIVNRLDNSDDCEVVEK